MSQTSRIPPCQKRKLRRSACFICSVSLIHTNSHIPAETYLDDITFTGSDVNSSTEAETDGSSDEGDNCFDLDLMDTSRAPGRGWSQKLAVEVSFFFLVE